MVRIDPREEYDDLLVTQSEELLEPDQFREDVTSEAATVGWVVLAYVFDDDGRVLLVKEPWADGWMTAGGVPEPDESLDDAVVREVREETGVEVSPVRPHAVDELTFENERTGESAGWTTVFFEVEAGTTEITDDLGVADEEITDARWFDGLPDDVYYPEMTERVYRLCLERRTSR